MNLDLSDADITVLVDLLKRTIDDARYPLSATGDEIARGPGEAEAGDGAGAGGARIEHE
jgi:hypothetical protein